MESGWRAASPSTVTPPGIRARYALTCRRSWWRIATSAPYPTVSAARAASSGASRCAATGSAATRARNRRYAPRRDALPAMITVTPTGASE